jgi:hypothetical protein
MTVIAGFSGEVTTGMMNFCPSAETSKPNTLRRANLAAREI